jgi:hypothetical protein
MEGIRAPDIRLSLTLKNQTAALSDGYLSRCGTLIELRGGMPQRWVGNYYGPL